MRYENNIHQLGLRLFGEDIVFENRHSIRLSINYFRVFRVLRSGINWI